MIELLLDSSIDIVPNTELELKWVEIMKHLWSFVDFGASSGFGLGAEEQNGSIWYKFEANGIQGQVCETKFFKLIQNAENPKLFQIVEGDPTLRCYSGTTAGGFPDGLVKTIVPDPKTFPVEIVTEKDGN